MIRTFSLQPQPEEKDRSFYAYGDHKPPPKPPKQSTSKPRSKVNQASSTFSHRDRHSSTAHHNANKSNQMGLSGVQGRKVVSCRGHFKQRGQSAAAESRQQQHSQQEGAYNQLRPTPPIIVNKQRRMTNADASPLLSMKRAESHFGASTQMMIEDGTASNVMTHEHMNMTPYLRPETQGTSPKLVNQDGNVKRFTNTFSGMVAEQQNKRIKTFNRQMTTDFEKKSQLAQLQAVAENVVTPNMDFRSRDQRASMVSDTLQRPMDNLHGSVATPKDNQQHHMNSAEHIKPLEGFGQVFDHFQQNMGGVDDVDQLSELRRIEFQMDQIKLAKSGNTGITSINERNATTISDLQSPPLNVVLPSNVQTGFQHSTNDDQKKQVATAKKIQDKRKKPRAKTAQSRNDNNNTVRHRHRSNQMHKYDVAEEEAYSSNLVVMNDKQMNIARGATAKGIVSLYNKGFVPKKTGKVSRKSKFATTGTTLYNVAESVEASTDNQDSAAKAADTSTNSAAVDQYDNSYQSKITSVDQRKKFKKTSVESGTVVISSQAYQNDRMTGSIGIAHVPSGGASFNHMEKILEHQAEDMLNTDAKQQRGLTSGGLLVPNIAALRDKRSSGVVGPTTKKAEIAGIRLEGANVRVSNSQLYERKESSEENFTADHTVVDRNSMQASEVVLQSVEAFARDAIIDYSQKEQHAQKLMQQMQYQPNKLHNSHNMAETENGTIVKGQFKLPRTQEVRSSTNTAAAVLPQATAAAAAAAHHQNLLLQSAVSSGVGTGELGLTNDDHESREFTEAEENVMRPINMQQERTNSARGKDVLLLIAEHDNKSSAQSKMALNDKFQSTINRVQSAGRKSIQTNKDLYNTDRRKSGERQAEFAKVKSNRTGTREGPISKDSSGILNRDLFARKSQETKSRDHRQANNYSYNVTEEKQKNTGGSFVMSKSVTPAGTSLSLFAGKTLQTRPLIGSQLVKNLVAKNITQNLSHQSLSDSRRQVLSQSHQQQQSQGINKNKAIHLEISGVEIQQNKVTVLTKGETQPLAQHHMGEQALLIAHSQGSQSPKAVTHGENAFLAVSSGRIHHPTDLRQIEKALSGLSPESRRSRGPSLQQQLTYQIKSDAVLVTNLSNQNAHNQTHEDAVNLDGLATNLNLQDLNERQGSHPLIGRFQSKTQQIDALGKVRHVFILNQTSNRDKTSSGERVAIAQFSKRSKDAKRRRRKKRPSSSRLNKRSPGFKLDLGNAKASNGEDIATVRGGSTSRNNQYSLGELGIHRANSDQNEMLIGNNVASSPNLRRHLKQLNTDTNRSLAAKLEASTPRSRENNQEGEKTLDENQKAAYLSYQHQRNESRETHGVTLGAANLELTTKKLSTLPAIENQNEEDQEQQTHVQHEAAIRDSLHQVAKAKVEQVHSSINEYLKDEEIARVQLIETRNSNNFVFRSSQDFAKNVQQKYVQEQNELQRQAPSQVTVYRDEENYNTNTLQHGTSGPTTSHNNPINAMYSHMSIQRGTGSIETTSRIDQITDPKLGEGTTFLATPQHEKEERVMFFKAPDASVDTQMKVITRIRSKGSKDFHESSMDNEIDDRRTVDFNEQVNLTQTGGQLDSQGEQVHMHEHQDHMPTQFLSSQHDNSQLSQQFFQLQMLPTHFKEFQPEMNFQHPDGYTVSLILSNASPIDGEQNRQIYADEFMIASLQQQQPARQFDLSSTIKKKQEMLLKDVQQKKTKAQPASSMQMKQDDLLARKERSVVSKSISTVPEKTLYQKRLNDKQTALSGLNVIGSQITQIYQHQDELNNTQELLKALEEHSINKDGVRTQIGPALMQEQEAADARSHALSSDQVQTLKEADVRSQETSPPRQFDQGVQNTYREELTSVSAGSRSGAVFAALEQSRRTVQTIGINANETQDREMMLKQSWGQYQTDELPYNAMQSTERQKEQGTSPFVQFEQLQNGPNALSSLSKNMEAMQGAAQGNDRATSINAGNLKIIPIKQYQPLINFADHQYYNINSPNAHTTSHDGTDLSISPYEVMKNRLMLSSTHHVQSSQNKLQQQQATQVDFSKASDRIYRISSEMNSIPGSKSNSTSKMVAPNQDLVDLADVDINRLPVHSGGQQLMATTPFMMQNMDIGNSIHRHNAGERTLEYGSKNSMEVVDEPKIKTIMDKEIGTDLAARRDTNLTAFIQQPRDKSDLNFARDDLRYSSASNITDQQNLHSAKDLQAALPSNFEVKIKKIGQASAHQNNKKQLDDGEYYQGAPPNYFMRKGSAGSSLSNGKITPNLTPMDRYQEKKLEETNKAIFRQSRNDKSPQISLAVETRNAMTGTRKKIIKSAVNSITADDRQSDCTQTEMNLMHHNAVQTTTLDYKENDYSSAHKVPSEFSHGVMNPRLVSRNRMDESPGKSSIQVTIGRVPSQQLANIGKDGQVNRNSNVTVAQKQEDDRKIVQSRSRVYEGLSASLFQVGQKSLQQLGVSSQITYQQSFNKIRDTVQRENEAKTRQETAMTQQQTNVNPNQKRRASNDLSRANRVKSAGMAKRNSMHNKETQFLLENNNGLLAAILEDPKPPGRKPKKRAQQKSALTRDGLKASQNLIDFSMNNQLNQNASRGLISNSSGVFDPQGDVLKFQTMKNNKMIQREQPDYTKKHSIQNMMAKRQQVANQLQTQNVPLPIMSGVNQTSVSDIMQQRHCTSSKSATGKPPVGNLRYIDADSSNANVAHNQQRTLSAMSDFEQQMELADQQRQQQARMNQFRPSSYSSQISQHVNQIGPSYSQLNSHPQTAMQFQHKPGTASYINGARFSTGQPQRPISSENYVSAKRGSGVTPNTGNQQLLYGGPQNNNSLPSQNTGSHQKTGKRTRPLTAQNRRAILSAKSKPSLAKGSSGYYATAAAGQIQGAGSDTQASSAVGIGVAHQQRHMQKSGGACDIPYSGGSMNMMEQQTASNQAGTGGITLISRNLQNEYATTYQHGGNHSSIGTIYQMKNPQQAIAASSPNAQFKFNEKAGVQTGTISRRSRPFSGVYRMNANKSLVGGGKSGSYQNQTHGPSHTISVNQQQDLS